VEYLLENRFYGRLIFKEFSFCSDIRISTSASPWFLAGDLLLIQPFVCYISGVSVAKLNKYLM
jgi:hypothetical protein